MTKSKSATGFTAVKKRTERVLLCLFVLLCGTKASAQWTVFDPSNLV